MTIRAAPRPSISATCRYRRELRSRLARERTARPPMAPEPAPALPAPEPPAMATARALAAPREPLAVAQTMMSPATASPARKSQQMSLDNVTCSYLRPVADRIEIDTGQFDRFRVISPNPLHRGPDHNIEIENQAAGIGISYHAPQPEKRDNAHASCGQPSLSPSSVMHLEPCPCRHTEGAALTRRNVVVAIG